MPGRKSAEKMERRGAWTSSGLTMFLLAVSGLAILGLVFLAAVWAGTESDAAALDRQRHLVNERLHDQVERVSQEVRLMSVGYAALLQEEAPGDDAKNPIPMHNRDTAIAETFGKIATTVFGYNAAFLVTPSGELALSSEPEAAKRFKWVWPLLQPLVRHLDARRDAGAEGRGSAADESWVELMRLEGRPSVVGVVSVSGRSPAGEHPGKDKPGLYLLVFRFLDGATLDRLSREQGLVGARYARTADPEKNEVAFQIESTATAEPIGFIIWEPDLPGSRVVGRLMPLLSVAGFIIVGLFFALMGRLRRSMSELHKSEHHARHLSVHDVLTGLPNRALFAARSKECLSTLSAHHDPALIALIDLDRFKDVNDTYGHAAGDELLKAAVERIQAWIQPGETLARLGGDEFALLLPDLLERDPPYIETFNGIIEDLRKPFQLQNGDISVHIGCSIGMAILDGTASETSEILRHADVALYAAKTSGRGRLVVYDPSMDRKDEAQSLRTDLRIALTEGLQDVATRDDDKPAAGGLDVFYQGLHYGDGSGALSGAEALVRWHHPVLGFLSPDKFLPLAEEAGLIDLLGEWVLRNAARAAAGWPAHMVLAVNVSPSQIRQRGFDSHILSILAEAGFPASRLELEITEAALFDIDEHAQAGLGRLRAQGVKIALDDFGTGFSSLSHLIQFNIDRIKIDRSFVRLLGTKAEGAAIVSAIVGLSRTLGKATTAEGVETEAQRDFLVAAGCSDLQGFLFSRPLGLKDFTESMSKHDARPPLAQTA